MRFISGTIKLIYNPFSGAGTFKDSLDGVIAVLQETGHYVSVVRAAEKGVIEQHLQNCAPFDAAVVAGGDGTLNIALNALLNNGHNVPLGIIPSGTANDFASFFNIPKEPVEAAKIIAHGKTLDTDVGIVNGRYFLNGCSAGFFTNVSHMVDSQVKSSIGKLAYYLKGFEQLAQLKPVSVKITNNTDVFTEDIFLFLALNTSGTGGFGRLAVNAQTDDGKFDFMAVKSCPAAEITVLLVKLLTNGFADDNRVIYFQDSYIKIELLSEIIESFEQTDTDGEPGPKMPVEIKNLHKEVKVFAPHTGTEDTEKKSKERKRGKTRDNKQPRKQKAPAGYNDD